MKPVTWMMVMKNIAYLHLAKFSNLKLKKLHRDKRGKSTGIVPNGHLLFDIVKC